MGQLRFAFCRDAAAAAAVIVVVNNDNDDDDHGNDDDDDDDDDGKLMACSKEKEYLENCLLKIALCSVLPLFVTRERLICTCTANFCAKYLLVFPSTHGKIAFSVFWCNQAACEQRLI
ncbi:unnamed protein product [Brugia pahangi]|uniref:Secreted protein n=1 Tax=Brugia pahangi TaxID=6280 RepID=A0A0N4TKT3_BRUPA|nr:unnamed protein product [Brugia pahangi]